MTFESIMRILTEPRIRRILDDETRTPYQRAADIHAALMANDVVDDRAPRKARTNKPKPEIESRDERPTQGDGEIG